MFKFIFSIFSLLKKIYPIFADLCQYLSIFIQPKKIYPIFADLCQYLSIFIQPKKIYPIFADLCQYLSIFIQSKKYFLFLLTYDNICHNDKINTRKSKIFLNYLLTSA